METPEENFFAFFSNSIEIQLFGARAYHKREKLFSRLGNVVFVFLSFSFVVCGVAYCWALYGPFSVLKPTLVNADCAKCFRTHRNGTTTMITWHQTAIIRQKREKEWKTAITSTSSTLLYILQCSQGRSTILSKKMDEKLIYIYFCIFDNNWIEKLSYWNHPLPLFGLLVKQSSNFDLNTIRSNITWCNAFGLANEEGNVSEKSCLRRFSYSFSFASSRFFSFLRATHL